MDIGDEANLQQSLTDPEKYNILTKARKPPPKNMISQYEKEVERIDIYVDNTWKMFHGWLFLV